MQAKWQGMAGNSSDAPGPAAPARIPKKIENPKLFPARKFKIFPTRLGTRNCRPKTGSSDRPTVQPTDRPPVRPSAPPPDRPSNRLTGLDFFGAGGDVTILFLARAAFFFGTGSDVAVIFLAWVATRQYFFWHGQRRGGKKKLFWHGQRRGGKKFFLARAATRQ